MWPMLIIIMRINLGSRKLLWPIVIGLFGVVTSDQCLRNNYLKFKTSL